jgi:Na+/H+ antiporter NhaD/arsenite permease-like protein
MIIPIVTLIAVFLLIALRHLLPRKLEIWQIMLGGALAVLLTGQISPKDAAASIDLDVMLFLFGMFVVGRALEESGYLAHLSYRLFRRAKSVDSLILSILFVMGFLSALLMNDTVAIIGVPIMLLLARKHGIDSKLLLLTLAFSVTIGSTMSPIGNPQNLLIAVKGNLGDPFTTFLKFLFLPTVLNLFLAFLLLKLFHRGQFRRRGIEHSQEPIKDRQLAALSKASLALIFVLIFLKVFAVAFMPRLDFRLTFIALASAAPVLLFSRRRLEILRKVDWHTLVFFAAMFVLMQSVWLTGFFQSLVENSGLSILSIEMILLMGVLLSQLISNVPLVALYLPLLLQAGAGTREMVALAAGSTIAGNLTILGAASNVIIIQNAERRTGESLTFFDFLKVGAPLTLLNVAVYWAFLTI